MATRRSSARGKIFLKDYFEESASGHTEESEIISLYMISQDKLMMEISEEYMNFFKKNNPEITEDFYEIKVDELVDFIKQRGTKSERKNAID